MAETLPKITTDQAQGEPASKPASALAQFLPLRVKNGGRARVGESAAHRTQFAVAYEIVDTLNAAPAQAALIARLAAALHTATKIADEAREEWDKAPDGMRPGKLLIALSGHLPGYRADIDEIFAALAAAEIPDV